MNIFARSATHLYVETESKVISISLNHSNDFISNTFYSLPLVRNESEAINLLDEIAYDDYADKYHQDYLNSMEESWKAE